MTTSKPSPVLETEVAYPHRFGPYALLCALGRGGMGAVHLAKHGSVAGIEKYCVVKTLRQKHVDNEEYISRFMDEARLVVHLGHRNICPIFDVGRVGAKYYLAMELIEGRDLNTLVESCWRAGKAVPPALAMHIVCEVLEALDYAHRRTHPVSGEPLHIVHRDVSPHNVMLNFEGEVKLIDFGLAASSLKVERTDPKIVLGKLSYMSREHLRAQPVDGRHDLFGVAVMLYEMLAGERYYADVPQDQILPRLADGTHVPRRLAGFDDELRGILARALASDARERTATCGELRDQVQQYMLRRQLSASTRELRALMDERFPGEHTSVRALLQRFVDVRPPPREQDESTVIARAGTRPVAAWDGVRNPITEPTGRIEIPSPPPAADRQAARIAPRLVAQAPLSPAPPAKARQTALWAAVAALVVLLGAAAVAWLFVLRPAPEAPQVALGEGAIAPRPAPAPPKPPPSEPAAGAPSASGAADRAAQAEGQVAAPPNAAPAKAVAPAAELAPAAEVLPRKPARRGARRRASAAKPPPLPADATPEEKIRYLDSHCGELSCARSLVDRFESVGLTGMTTDEVRAFWPRVNRCASSCSE